MGLPTVDVIPPVKLYKGPDALRGAGLMFIYTSYADSSGKRFFVEPGTVGHEAISDRPDVLQALFGPGLEELKPQFTSEDGTIDYWKVRQLSQDSSLYGRYGKIGEQPVIMLWGMPKNWRSMLREVILKLNPPKDTVVTSGVKTQFYARDFLADRGNDFKDTEDKERLSALARYHIATGAEKEALRRQYGFGNPPAEYPQDTKSFKWRRSHWTAKARQLGLPNPFDYGENLQFSDWLNNDEAAGSN